MSELWEVIGAGLLAGSLVYWAVSWGLGMDLPDDTGEK